MALLKPVALARSLMLLVAFARAAPQRPPRAHTATESRCVDQGNVVFFNPDYEQFVSSVLEVTGDQHALKAGMTCTRQRGLWLEFGVYRGETLRKLAQYARQARKADVVFGFDGFMGLPEKWREPPSMRMSKYVACGSFSLKGRPPFSKGQGIDFEHARQPLAMLHADVDLSSSTDVIFKELWAAKLLQPGVVIIFDELLNYKEYMKHEILALWELMGSLTLPHTAGLHGGSAATAGGAASTGGDRGGFGAPTFRGRGRELAVEILGTSILDVRHDGTKVWPQACAVRLLAVERGWPDGERRVLR
ncbi:hypothetical protein T492DRAFT_833734 [Pavlovales sp. CCMP2436]|nr:hypothetical protein T492DRAFT_833734 [Pavlovales sp. CCMP2436]